MHEGPRSIGGAVWMGITSDNCCDPGPRGDNRRRGPSIRSSLKIWRSARVAAIPAGASKPPVLLIDDTTRRRRFSKHFLELLADFQVSIPDRGTISAKTNSACGLDPRTARANSPDARPLPLSYATIRRRPRGAPHHAADRGAVRIAVRLQIRAWECILPEELRKVPGVAETWTGAGGAGRARHQHLS